MGLLLLFSSLIGLILGSFISMLSWRLPRLMDLDPSAQFKAISVGGSKCPHCQSQLPWYRLIPLVSWLISRGRCHQCHTPISPRYPLIELSSALLLSFTIWHYGLTLEGVLVALFLLWLLTLSIIDLEHHLILDNLSLPLLWLGLIINAFGLFTPAQDAILGAVAGYLILWLVFHAYRLLTAKEGMGYGDFKLLAALGAWTGVNALAQIIVLSALSSLIVAFILIMLRRQDWQSQLAFGPYLALGGAISLIYGDEILLNLIS
ncbi:MAG: A24 family peptidase [Thiomicrospira sp.]